MSDPIQSTLEQQTAIIKQLTSRVDSLQKSDSWKNVLVGLSKAQDKTISTTYDTFTYLDDTTVGNIYFGDGIGAKMVDIIPEDMVKKGITVGYPEGDDDSKKNAEKLQKEFFRKGALKGLKESMSWRGVYGGSILLINTVGSGLLWRPLNSERIRGIEGFKAIPRKDINLSQSNFDRNVQSPTYGKVEQYNVDMKSLYYQKQANIHVSRMVEFFGKLVPDDIGADTEELRYWGGSDIQRYWNALKGYGSITQGIENIILEFIINVFKFENVRGMLATDNGEALMERMDIISRYKSILNSVILGTEEDFIRNTASVAGLPDLYDRFMMNLSAVSGIPVTKLFGRSPAGENATGEGDEDNYNAMIEAKQETELRLPIQYILSLMASYLKLPDNFSFKFNPLKPISQKEEAEIEKYKAEAVKIQAEADKIYIETGVRTNVDVQEERFPEEA